MDISLAVGLMSSHTLLPPVSRELVLQPTANLIEHDDYGRITTRATCVPLAGSAGVTGEASCPSAEEAGVPLGADLLQKWYGVDCLATLRSESAAEDWSGRCGARPI